MVLPGLLIGDRNGRPLCQDGTAYTPESDSAPLCWCLGLPGSVDPAGGDLVPSSASVACFVLVHACLYVDECALANTNRYLVQVRIQRVLLD